MQGCYFLLYKGQREAIYFSLVGEMNNNGKIPVIMWSVESWNTLRQPAGKIQPLCKRLCVSFVGRYDKSGARTAVIKHEK